MVSTRYSMAKTRSQKQGKKSVVTLTVLKKSNSPCKMYGPVGTFKSKIVSPDLKSSRHIKVISPSKTKKKHIVKQSKQKIGQKNKSTNKGPLDVMSCGEKVGKKSGTVKHSKVTKHAMPCKISNKINCPVHKKVQHSVSTKAKNVRKQKSLVTRFPEFTWELKSKRTCEKNEVSKIINPCSNENRKNTRNKLSDSKSKANTKNHTPKNNPIISMENKKLIAAVDPSSITLSPVTFKKNIRNFLMCEILRKQQENDKRHDSIVKNQASPTGNSLKGKSRTSRSSSSITSSLSSKTKHLISKHETCRFDKSGIPSVSTTDVPNLILSSNPKYDSTNKPNHSTSEKNSSKSLKNSSLPITNEKYNTRSSYYRGRVATRNIIRNNKFLKFGLKNISKQNMSSSVKKLDTTFRKQTKPTNKVNIYAQDDNVQSSASGTCLNKTNRNLKSTTKKAVQLNSKNGTQTMKSDKKNEELVNSERNKDDRLRRKMLALMARKFGSNSVGNTKQQRKDQEEFDSEILNIVDDLESVDKYVNAKILSFKLKDNIIEFPQQAQKISNSLIIHKNSPNTPNKFMTNECKMKSNQLKTEVRNVSSSYRHGKKKQSLKETIHSNQSLKNSPKTMSVCNSRVKPKLRVTPNVKARNLSQGALEVIKEDDKDATANSNETIATASTINKSRTTLPLTIKTKIVVAKGKKVKKKLSQKEQRIYNLLRCYGNNSLVKQTSVQVQKNTDILKDKPASPVKSCSHKGSSKNEKNKEVSPKGVPRMQKRDNHNVKDKSEKRSPTLFEVIKKSSMDDIREKVQAEKREVYSAKEKVISDDKTEDQDENINIKHSCNAEKVPQKSISNLDKVNLHTPNKSHSPTEKSIMLSDREKLRLHKGKYNISKDFEVSSCKVKTYSSKNNLSKSNKMLEDDCFDTANADHDKKSDCNNISRDETSNVQKNIRNEISHKAKDFEQKRHLSSKNPKKSIDNEFQGAKQISISSSDIKKYKIPDITKENTLLSSNSSGIESADEVLSDCMESEVSTQKESEKSKNKKIILSSPPKNIDSASDDSISSFFQKYKTSSNKKISKEKSSTPLATVNNIEIDVPYDKKKKSHKQTPHFKNVNPNDKKVGNKKSISINNHEKSPNNTTQTLNQLPTRKNQSHSTESLNNINYSDRSTKVINDNLGGDTHSDLDIFDDSRNTSSANKKPMNENNNDRIRARNLPSFINQSLVNKEQVKDQIGPDSSKLKERNEKINEIANEHVNKYKTKDLVDNLMQWTTNESQLNSTSLTPVKNKEDVGNYRDYTTRTGITQNPVRILKRKACQDYKNQMNNEYKNRRNGKDYFQCICFNKFFITRVRNNDTHNFDILTVKVKPNQSENVPSLGDVQFCTFCSRLYEKYKDNFILINQEYIMKEFIEKHSNSWKRINKSYDNEFDMNVTSNMSNFCDLSLASATTSTPYESLTNSRTESRLDSISSDKTESINMGSEYSDYYLNEIFLKNMKKARDPSKLASSHKFQHYKQKCRNVNMKINEICDLYRASKRISSTETRSNVTDDCAFDDGMFARPNNITAPFENGMGEPNNCRMDEFERARNRMSCKSQLLETHTQQARKACYSQKNQQPCTPSGSCRYRKQRDFWDDSDEHTTPPKKLRTPSSFTCSRSPKSDNMDDDSDEHMKTPKNLRTPTYSHSPNSLHSPRRCFMRKHKLEKTQESFERIFQKVWQKCSPSAKRCRNTKDNWRPNLTRDKKSKLLDEFHNSKIYRQHLKKKKSLKCKNQSLLSSDFTDEYDADFSDSDGNRDTNDSAENCYKCPKPKANKSSQYSMDKEGKQDFLNSSLGNNVIYKERHHQYVNKLFIKQSSRHLFTNRKTSYSDSEQVIKIQNVKKKIYTTIHQKVYNTQDNLMSGGGFKQCNKCDQSEIQSENDNQKPFPSCSQNSDHGDYRNERKKCPDISNSSTSPNKSQRKINNTAVNSSNSLCNHQDKITPLKDKIQQIEYENLWNKLVTEEQVNDEVHQQNAKESDHSDSVIETDIEKGEQPSKCRSEEDSGIQSPRTFTGTQPHRANETSEKYNEKVILKIDSTNCPKETNNKERTNNLVNEILVTSTRKVNNYESIKEDIKKYATAVSQAVEPFNKQYVLKLIKNLVKNKRVNFKDYENVLKELKINVNLNDNNKFMIKQVTHHSGEDSIIMKSCYEKLFDKYHHHHESELSTSTILNENLTEEPSENYSPDTGDQLETFESFRAYLINGSPASQQVPVTKYLQHNEKFLEENNLKQTNNFESHVDIECGDKFNIQIQLDENKIVLKKDNNNVCAKDDANPISTSVEGNSTPVQCKSTPVEGNSTPVECKSTPVECNSTPGGEVDAKSGTQSPQSWVDLYEIKQEVVTPELLEDTFAEDQILPCDL